MCLTALWPSPVTASFHSPFTKTIMAGEAHACLQGLNGNGCGVLTASLAGPASALSFAAQLASQRS